jgi:hypothetical protein
MAGEISRLHSSSRLRNEIEAENLVGRAGRRSLHRGSPVCSDWPGLVYRIRVPALMSWRKIAITLIMGLSLGT